ncbi:MAG: UDP-glucose 4-epimerase GalE [Phycisphaerae bacterium]|nr:UDP-glucose 4-epimerase GalE [Phycisphaerae bacterium]
MKVFVTGGAGYVGSHCVKRIVAAGHQVTVYDNLSKGHMQAVDPKAEFVRGDLADADKLGKLLRDGRYDAVMHFAAALDVGESVREPLWYFRNNVVNTIGLLEQMKATDIKRIVFSSTCAIYGVPEDLPITEDLPKNPINPYGLTKLTMERAFATCAEAWGLGSTSLRYFNASGAAADGSIGQDYQPVLHLIPVVLQVPLGQRKAVSVFGTDYPTPDGSCVRDYIHVEDLAEAHLLALEAVKEGRTEAYNVGTGRGHSVLEVIAAARAVTGHNIPVELGARRPGDPPELYSDPQKLRDTLGWMPRYREIEAVIETAWRWHSAHPDGFGKA